MSDADYRTDERLSGLAVGILARMLADPDYPRTIKGIASRSYEGQVAVGKARSLLKQYGYLTDEQTPGFKGSPPHTTTTISPQPRNQGSGTTTTNSGSHAHRGITEVQEVIHTVPVSNSNTPLARISNNKETITPQTNTSMHMAPGNQGRGPGRDSSGRKQLTPELAEARRQRQEVRAAEERAQEQRETAELLALIDNLAAATPE